MIEQIAFDAVRILYEQDAEIERLRIDVARYRWLVNCNDGAVWSFLSGMDADQIDDHIDAWRAADTSTVVTP